MTALDAKRRRALAWMLRKGIPSADGLTAAAAAARAAYPPDARPVWKPRHYAIPTERKEHKP